ncbi:MAG: DUF3102 domain-containing protein [Cyanobacteria bacterium J06635_13]
MSSQIQKTTENSNFNYQALDSQRRNEIEQATSAIRERLRKAAQDIWEIGKMLNEVQSKLQRGQFDEWIKTEFDWSRRTAYKFISVFKRFDNSVNLEEINIATSALYLLAAESTPETVREEFIQKAQSGEKVTHQQVLKVVKKAKDTDTKEPEMLVKSENTTQLQPIINPIIIPDVAIEKPLELTQSNNNANVARLIIDRGWNQTKDGHQIYCGDTALPEFANYIPYSDLAIAVTTDDWAHDWLIEKAKTVVVFPEVEYNRQKLTGLLVMFSAASDKIILPWLPNAEMIALVHQLGRKVYAGDVDVARCQAAVNYMQVGSNEGFVLKP